MSTTLRDHSLTDLQQKSTKRPIRITGSDHADLGVYPGQHDLEVWAADRG
jgi:hypothetical protein